MTQFSCKIKYTQQFDSAQNGIVKNAAKMNIWSAKFLTSYYIIHRYVQVNKSKITQYERKWTWMVIKCTNKIKNFNTAIQVDARVI